MNRTPTRGTSRQPKKSKSTREKVDPRKRLAFNIEVNQEAFERAEKAGGRRPVSDDRFTPKKGEEFLRLLTDGATVILACESIGLSRTCLYKQREKDTDFAAAWDVAYEKGTDALEHEAERRAVRGVTEPVFYKGEVAGHVQKYSDVLLIFLLKARRPEKFRDKVDLSNSDGSLAAALKGFADAVRKSAS